MTAKEVIMCNRSEQINELSAALAKAQSEFRAAAFNATNPFLKNKYADLGAVIEAARPALTKNGLAIIQPVTITDAQVTVETILSHQSGQWISGVASMPIDAGKGMTAVQSAGSLITYLRRYGIASLVGIYADEDADGNKAQDGKNKDEKKQGGPAPTPAPTNNHKVIRYEDDNGAQVEVRVPAMTPSAESITFDTACKVVNSKNQPYGDIDSATLYFMYRNLEKSIGAGGSPEDIDSKKYKRDCIIRILNDRE